MAFTDGQLGKMTIIFYPIAAEPGDGIRFTPMYNPSSLTVNHSLKHECKSLLSSGSIARKFLRTNPKKLSVDLFFDGTSASPSNLSGLGIDVSAARRGVASGLNQLGVDNVVTQRGIGSFNDVDIQIETFLRLGSQIDSEYHQPHYLQVIWGNFIMNAVVNSANVTYSMFDADGRPLRAKMTIQLEEYVDFEFWQKEQKLKSADVSKSITVVAGDTLPLLCFRQYGDSNLYGKIAEVNNLTNYRHLKPGMELLFPPLTTLPE